MEVQRMGAVRELARHPCLEVVKRRVVGDVVVDRPDQPPAQPDEFLDLGEEVLGRLPGLLCPGDILEEEVQPVQVKGHMRRVLGLARDLKRRVDVPGADLHALAGLAVEHMLVGVRARVIRPEQHRPGVLPAPVGDAARLLRIGDMHLPETVQPQALQGLVLHPVGIGRLVALVHHRCVLAMPAPLVENLVDMVERARLGQLEKDVVVDPVDDILAEFRGPLPGRPPEHPEIPASGIRP